MVKISDLARWMIEHPSAIREIMTLVAEFEKHPEKWPRKLIYLAGGWPQDPPPEILKEKLLEVINDTELWRKGARYSPTVGYPDTIEAVINYEKEIWNRNITQENVVFGLGSSEQIGAVFLALVNPGDEVILTSPGYLNYKRQLDLELKLKAIVKYWRIINEDAIFDPNFDDLQNKMSNKTKLIIVTTPGNPDGQVWSDEQIKAILDIAEDNSIYVLFDLAYRAFIFDENKIPMYLSKTPGEFDIWSCTMSKELRIPGWRASYLIIPSEIKRSLDTIEQARTLAPVSLIQLVFQRFFNDKTALRKLSQFYREGAIKYGSVANRTVSLLKDIPKINVLEPKGGFYVFLDVSAYDKDSKRVWKNLINSYQVALAPGVDFNGFEGWLRLSFAPVIESTELLEEGLMRIKEFFESYGK